MPFVFREFVIRSWEPRDREAAAAIIGSVLAEYGLNWEPEDADRDVVEVETCYLNVGGEFWVVERDGSLVGTAAYYPVPQGTNAVEIRKMYVLPEARGQGLGRALLGTLEEAIAAKGYSQVWIETATVLKEATRLYERNGYVRPTGEEGIPETTRCDRVYVKHLSVHSDMSSGT
ncbi:MAG: GNAT family N-acetyltransferase [Cyanobacteria bacterium J06648_11]